MSKAQAMIYAAFVFLEIFGVAALMEVYKKTIRKDKAKKVEIYIVAEILTVLCIVILKALNIFKPILGLIGAPLWADYILYNIGIYFFQMQADMKIIKKLIKSCASEFLKSKGFTTEQIDNIFGIIEKKSE